MGFVRVRDVSKRVRVPAVLTIEQFLEVLLHIPEPYRTMCVVAGCLGLRISEVRGLQWCDFDWEKRRVQIRRSEVTLEPLGVQPIEVISAQLLGTAVAAARAL